ncbi:hypothetical protein HUJ04_002247 [Dendroctonus ponderosae]
MNLLPTTRKQFSDKDYWDAFFKKRGNKSFEWYGEYPELSNHLHKYVKTQDNILIAGCGNSTLGRDLYDVGCSKVINIDLSKLVIKQMQQQTDKDRPGLQYIEMDVLNTSFKNEEFSVIIDKATIDALMPDDSEESVKIIKQYFEEIQRITKNNGRYVCISLLQDYVLQQLLDFFPKNHWMFRAVRCFEPEQKAQENGESSMPIFMVVCTKFKSLPRQILEVNLCREDKMFRCQSCEEVQQQIVRAQRAAFVCSSLQKTRIGDKDQIEMMVYDQADQNQPRYTIHIVEIPPLPKNGAFAVFVVPEGREAEWLFSTESGRNNLASMTNHNRLAIVSMHRGQKYESLNAVQLELEYIIQNLAPSTIGNSKIPCLSLCTDLGKRTVRHEGSSPLSGDYIVEDVEHDDGQKFRRLFYLSSQLVIQSEAKIKTITTRGRKKKDVLDLLTLTCQHHVYMSIATCLTVKDKGDVVVLGLGGGGLCSFLHKFLPNCTITAIEIDPEMLKIATEWFGFAPDDKLKATIQDGLDFIRNLQKQGKQVDALLCDVDSKTSDVGMSCPPEEFLSSQILESVSKAIASKGVFIVNIVLRDQSLRGGIVATLNHAFKKVLSYKLVEDLNEVFICSNMEVSEQHIKDSLKRGTEAINQFFRKNRVTEEVDIVEYLNNLQINN